MKNKIKIKFLDQEFLLPSDVVREDGWYEGKYIYLNAKNTAVVIRQFIKNNYNTIKGWVTSDVYSGGSSVRVNIWSKNGSAVPYQYEQEIKAFTNSLKAGSFDGMHDIYNYREDKLSTDNGTRIAGLPSYIFVENRPKWGTLEYWLSEWKSFDEDRYDERFRNKYGESDDSWTNFLNWNREFFGKGVEVKLVKYMNDLNKHLQELGYELDELCA